MNLFLSTLSQIAFLFGFIIIGYGLVKWNVLPKNSAMVLSKLENTVFIPALVAGTFINNFTVERVSAAKELLMIGSIITLAVIPFAIFIPKMITNDTYIQRIYTYGLTFSNFGFMGNAVVMSLFPDIFFEYLFFTFPLWVLIYVWGIPKLLMADAEKKQTFTESLKTFINPMFVAMLVGMVIGLIKIPIPGWIMSLIDASGNCMSPVAMLLTGMVISTISFRQTFTNVKIYIISIIRLVVLPLVFIAVASCFELSEMVYTCALCSLAMPLGLNTIVIPSALGKDTSMAAGMAVISHLLAGITIPLIFLL